MNRPQALVSAIIPVFNGQDFIVQCIESVLEQDYPFVEVIVIDDGSTDDTANAARKFHAAVKYVHQANHGTSVARNRGIELSKGTYVAFLDHDDLWMPEKISLQVKAMVNNPELDAVFTQVMQFKDASLSKKEQKLIALNEAPMPGLIPSAVLVRREIFESVGFFTPGVYLEWADWYMRAVQSGFNAIVIEKVLARRRVHRHNKGRAQPDCRNAYARLVKAALDRSRQRKHVSISQAHQPDILRLNK